MSHFWRVLGPEEAGAYHPLVLAYVGDAVYELAIRTALLKARTPVDQLHQRSVAWVSAQGQEKVWQWLKPRLEADEADVARRARNARAVAPRSATVATYRRATALEAVMGYLYLTGRYQRIAHLLGQAVEELGGDAGPEGAST